MIGDADAHTHTFTHTHTHTHTLTHTLSHTHTLTLTLTDFCRVSCIMAYMLGGGGARPAAEGEGGGG